MSQAHQNHRVMIEQKDEVPPKPRIAIIGLGISGLGCAHFLKDHASLTLYEANDYIGGHTNTVTIQERNQEVSMDTGFMVYNEDTYPHLTRLFAELGVKTKETCMSFSVNHLPDGLEYNGGTFRQIFGQLKNLANFRFWRMLFKIKKFHADALEDIENEEIRELTLEQYVRSRGYGENFLNWYLVPMASAVWSSPPERVLDFPAITLLRFWRNHGFLATEGRKQWRTVCGGAKHYVTKLIEPLRNHVQLGNPVSSVAREGGKVRVISEQGSALYDQVILATHADDSLRLLADPTEREQSVLSAFSYQENLAVVHTDQSVMPTCKHCWASWNYRITAGEQGLVSSTIYWMNSLQGVSENEHYFVSINPEYTPQQILKTIQYQHPLFDLDAIAAQQRVPELHQDAKDSTNTFFCGAWQRYGFHEDGLLSAIRVCEMILSKDITG